MFGNLTNRLLEGGNQPVPEVGMGVTECMWSDRHAYTVVEVYKNKKGVVKEIVVQSDRVIRTDTNGISESQNYRYEPDPNGGKKTVTLRKNGRWITQGDPLKGGTGWMIGERCEYYDPSF
jgi:hypothetical protein